MDIYSKKQNILQCRALKILGGHIGDMTPGTKKGGLCRLFSSAPCHAGMFCSLAAGPGLSFPCTSLRRKGCRLYPATAAPSLASYRAPHSVSLKSGKQKLQPSLYVLFPRRAYQPKGSYASCGTVSRRANSAQGRTCPSSPSFARARHGKRAAGCPAALNGPRAFFLLTEKQRLFFACPRIRGIPGA